LRNFHSRKVAKGNSRRGIGVSYVWVITVLVIAAGISIYCVLRADEQADLAESQEPRAAIIDQLHVIEPDTVFIEQATRLLEGYGFAVDLYQGTEVNVALYCRLPRYGYRLIVFRVHSALRADGDGQNYSTWLFSNEPYSETRYLEQQLGDRLGRATIDESHPWVFAVSSGFVTEDMEGDFDNAAIIMMGCGTVLIEDMARAFTEKGASTYIGWNERVSLEYVDTVTLELLGKLLAGGMTVNQAVTSVMSVVGPDMEYGAELGYYPLESADKDLEELLKRGQDT